MNVLYLYVNRARTIHFRLRPCNKMNERIDREESDFTCALSCSTYKVYNRNASHISHWCKLHTMVQAIRSV